MLRHLTRGDKLAQFSFQVRTYIATALVVDLFGLTRSLMFSLTFFVHLRWGHLRGWNRTSEKLRPAVLFHHFLPTLSSTLELSLCHLFLPFFLFNEPTDTRTSYNRCWRWCLTQTTEPWRGVSRTHHCSRGCVPPTRKPDSSAAAEAVMRSCFPLVGRWSANEWVRTASGGGNASA